MLKGAACLCLSHWATPLGRRPSGRAPWGRRSSTRISPGAENDGATTTAGTADISAALGFRGTSTPSEESADTCADIFGMRRRVTAVAASVTPSDDVATTYDMSAPLNVPLRYHCRNVSVYEGPPRIQHRVCSGITMTK